MDHSKVEKFKSLLSDDHLIGPLGIRNSQAKRFYEENDNYPDVRPPFFRDVDRIVHSLCFSRYIDRSQVFFNLKPFNANITHRSLHVKLVSRISQQIGRILKLNTDLIEAIALGHDLGHTPAGHLGEVILDELSRSYNLGGFLHNAQSVRWLFYLEKRFPKKPARGLNLTLQTLDGILCHDGEVNERELKPVRINGKNWEDHLREYNDAFSENNIKRIPMTYEGVVVRFSDTIAYIGRDIEDAILLKFIKRSDIPTKCKKILGDTNRKIIYNLIMDLISFSYENEIIGYSEKIFNALKELKKFNYENIYNKRDLYYNHDSEISYMKQLKEKFELIFKSSLDDLKIENYQAPIFKDHIEYIDDKNYSTYYEPLKRKQQLPLIVRDYIAGMSDKYFNDIFERFKNREKN
ncbi:MAG: deoxyguanosinetriphosphate triphosphohydrolase family protein [Candidatus Thorarchaeota archaeon]